MYDYILLSRKMTDTALCRVCLESDAKMQHIADTRYQEIFEKLSTKLCTADRRPETVCYICFALLQRCQRLVDMSRRAEKILTQLSLNGIQATPEAVTEMKLSIKHSLSVVPMQYLHISDTHDSSHVTVKEEVISMKDEGTAEEEPLMETVTENVLSSERNINECLKFKSDSDHDQCNELPSTMVVEQPKLKMTYCCDLCSKIFSVKRKLALHIKRLHTRLITDTDSDICDKQFNQQCVLTRHMRVHAGEKPYTCDICDKQFTQKSNHTTHMRVHTGEKPYTCGICDKKVTHRTRHMRVHTGEKPYTCDICDKQFTQKSNHTTHMRVHTGEKPYTCGICNKKVTHHKIHMRVHTGEKPYTCDICDKQFNDKSNHTRHMRVHTGEKPFTCDICNKQFNQQCGLTRHMRVHTGEKPYACDICDKQFNQKTSVTTHMKIHTGEKAFTCDIQINQKCNLATHT